jgi:hypothetical protein
VVEHERMRTVLIMALTIACLVAGIEAGVALGDRRLFVSPPEAVVENFVRHLAARRYDRARAVLDRDRASYTTLEQLRELVGLLKEQTGSIVSIDGRRGTIGRHEAMATAQVVGDRAPMDVGFRLSWEDGRWRISSWRL